jgi:ABC-type polysaccharide/polyol phosphate transport system ATPase subunit
MGAPAVELRSVGKAYRLYAHPRHRVLELLSFGRRTYHTDFWALRDVDLRLRRGTTVGVIGRNGSGKSTLLQVVAGIVQPTSGQVVVNGRVACLLELGAGFSPDFTGRENVLMYGAVMGLSRRAALERLPAVEAFAEIGDFMDRPVKTYSSGMFVRLAFAAAIHVDPDVLLVDEALAVGDIAFQHRCLRRIREFQAQGKTILFVSHDVAMVKAVCTEAILLEAGRVQAAGDPADVVNRYHARLASGEDAREWSREPRGPGRAPASSPAPASAAPAAEVAFRADATFETRAALFRHGTGAARIRNVELLDRHRQPLPVIEFDQEVLLRVHLEFLTDVPASILGYIVRDKTGIDVLGTNTLEENVPLPPHAAGDRLVVDFRQRWPLAPGAYSVTTALADSRTAPSYLDWVDNALLAEVLPPPGGKLIHARVWLPVQIAIHPG